MLTRDQLQWHIERHQSLKDGRGNWERLWQDVVDYLCPWKADIVSPQVPGRKKTYRIHDGTPGYSLNVLTAGLMGHLTSQSSPWFQLVTRNPNLMHVREIGVWLQEVTRRMITCFNASNFQTSVHEFFEDLAAFGTGTLLTLADPVDIVRFYVFPIRELQLLENQAGVIDTVYREYAETVRQLAQAFGPEALSRELLELLREKPEQEVTCVHAVFPREGFNPNLRLASEKPFASVYFVPEHRHVLFEGGFDECPWHVARWKKGSRETYGRGPGIDAMPDIKTLNQQRRSDLRGGQKMVEPPLWVPASFKDRLRTAPNAMNYYKRGEEPAQPLNLVGQLPFGMEMTQDTRELVKKAFFVDIFLLLAQQRGEKTAYEVAQRVQERLMILGPVLGRLHAEAMGPAIERSFSIMARAGYFPPPPQALMGQKLDIEYISPLAKAMRAMEGQATQDALIFAQGFLGMDPEAADNIDADMGIRRGWEIYGAPMDLLRDPRDVSARREARAKQARSQNMIAALQQGMDISKTAAEAQAIGGGAGGAA